MAWLTTVTSNRPCGFDKTGNVPDAATERCEEPATTRLIDDNGVEQGVWCRWHAQAFLDRLRAVS